jgi:iron complex outermembrane receptor protein
MSLISRPAPILVAVSMLAGIGCPASAKAAAGEEEGAQYYAVPAGPLEESLSRIARQSGRSLLADPSLLRGRRGAAVEGRLSATDAARRALTGSGLELVVTTNGTLSVRLAHASPANDDSTGVLAPVTVSATALAAGYLADQPSSVATKTALPPRMTPFSVNQASEELMVERGDQNIYEVLERFSGVTADNGQSDIGINMDRYLSIRGFDTAGGNDGQTLINGQRVYGSGAGMRGTDSLESVELLRGPASLYYGAAQPGGVFNFNYKRPRAEAAYVLRGRVDSEGSRGGMVDMTGPLNEDRSLRYRLVGSYTHYEDDQRHVWSRPNSVMAALQWAPSSQFETTLTYEYLDIEAVPEKENNKRTVSGEYYPIAVEDSFLGHLNDRAERTAHTLIWDSVWRPSNGLKVNTSLSYQASDQWYQVTRPSGSGGGGTPPDPSPSGDLPRSVSFSPNSQRENISGAVDVSGMFQTGAFRHEWLVGGGFGESKSRSKSRPTVSGEFDSGNYVSPRNGRTISPGRYAPAPLNIYALDNGNWMWRDVVMEESAYMVPWAQRKDLNVYLQDMVHLPDGRTRLMAALGWSQYDNLARGRYDWNTGLRGNDTEHKTDSWSPRLAAMHDVSSTATVYVSYGESFAPQPSLTLTDASGIPLLAPEEGVQYEIGYKQDLQRANGLFTAALFRIDKENMARAANSETCDGAVTDPSDPFYCYYGLDGLQRSQGVELSLSGEVMPGWLTSINYTYLDTEVVETADVYQLGRSFAGIPRHSISVWNKFRLLQDAELGSLWLGAGLRAQSGMHTNYTASGTTELPGFGVVDLGLFWQRKLGERDLRVNLNLINAFNRTLYVGSSARPGSTLIYANTRRLLLTAQLSF